MEVINQILFKKSKQKQKFASSQAAADTPVPTDP
jgi:hypothetical protein